MIPTIASAQAIKDAAACLKRGELVAFPTETVYGLGADASNPKAIDRLYQAKGRPTKHPVIVHIAKYDQIFDWVAAVPPQAKILAEKFWFWPLTLVLPKSKTVLDTIVGGQNSVGIRIPSHPIAQQLLTAFAGGLAAPSANKFGRLSPTSAQNVCDVFTTELSMVLDGGDCTVGIESTIVAFTGERPQILRPGIIDADQLAHVLGLSNVSELSNHSISERVPGNMSMHYAPHTPVRLLDADQLHKVIDQVSKDLTEPRAFGILSFNHFATNKVVKLGLEASREPIEYAHHLYRQLRALDQSGANELLIELPPHTTQWQAIRDRLQRAAGTKVEKDS